MLGSWNGEKGYLLAEIEYRIIFCDVSSDRPNASSESRIPIRYFGEVSLKSMKRGYTFTYSSFSIGMFGLSE